VLAVVAAGLWFVVLVAPGASAQLKSHPAAVTHAAASCPAGSTCETIPTNCPAGTTCPEVIVTPSTVGPEQWAFVTAEDFPAGDPIYIYYCSNKFSLAKQDPVCMLQATPELLNPEVVLTASPTGSASISFGTQEDENDGNSPLTGKIPGTQTVGSFYCDDFGNPCSIDVSDPYLNNGGQLNFVLNPNNAVAVPITFAKSSSGCPKATFVTTQEEFGIDRLFPIASQFDCVGNAPAIGIPLASDSLAAVTGLVGGADQLAFIDDPNAPDVQAELALLKGSGGKPGYSLVPIALSAQVIGYKALMAASEGGRIYPDNTFELTPTMVAGLITNYYTSQENADIAPCGKRLGDCSLLGAINSVNGFRLANEFGGYVRSDPSSSTSEIFQWICNAPNVPVKIGKHKVHDPNVASDVLVAGLKSGGVTEASCPTTDTFPPLIDLFAWAAVDNPNQQALKLSGLVPPPNGTSTAVAGFAPMNWSEASYYGLLPAALQNPAGEFVLPSTASLQAALTGATVNANGTLSPNFDDANPAAYPLPDLWYAVVPTTPQPAVTAAALRTLLDDMLTITGGSQTADLPPGFVPLPSAMYTASLAAVAKDVQVAPPVTTTTTTTTTAVAGGGTTTTTSASVTTTTLVATPTTSSHGGTPTTSPKVTPSSAPKITATTVAFQSTSFSVFGHGEAWMLPSFVSVAAGALIFGPGLLFKTRRRPGGVH